MTTIFWMYKGHYEYSLAQVLFDRRARLIVGTHTNIYSDISWDKSDGIPVTGH